MDILPAEGIYVEKCLKKKKSTEEALKRERNDTFRSFDWRCENHTKIYFVYVMIPNFERSYHQMMLTLSKRTGFKIKDQELS
jgi:mannose/fructose/N-acetylgalactosamine-specific phosphotransferase system component IID